MQTLLGESKRCKDHRHFGLWAIDSLNSNVASTALVYLEDTTADVVMLQELRVDDEQALPVQRAASRAGWSLAVEPAMPTDSGSMSAGVGIA
eukprot:288113-Heterocapsa_arctica.AAC.1